MCIRDRFSGEITNKFFGSFDGNGKTISNFRLNRTSWNKVGFFGAIEDAAVKNLTLKPGKTVCGQKEVAILDVYKRQGCSVGTR